MSHPGLLSWANSVRMTMASDPGRQLFKDQVQTHGFLFLDDYLDNIISGAKQDPLIELVKTPGRKKAIAKKPKLVSSKLAAVVSVSLEDDMGSENAAPANDLQKALFAAKPVEVNTHNIAKGEKKPPPNIVDDKPVRTALAPIQPSSSVSLPTPHTTQHLSLLEPIVQPSAEHNDLSIIAEDEEPVERIRSSTAGPADIPSVMKSHHEFVQLIESSSVLPPLLVPQDSNSASTDTFHSIPLDSPSGNEYDAMDTGILSNIGVRVEEGDTGLLPSPPLNHLQGHEVTNTSDTLHANDKLNAKPSVALFPTLPEPMPLRKPPRDHSMNAVMLGAATPVATAGKRTSWLMKAREVKALEGTTNRVPLPSIGSIFSSALTLPQGTKRKSGDVFSAPLSGLEEEERQQKVFKIVEGETAPRKSQDVQGQDAEQLKHQPQVEERAGDVQVESGVLGLLKKTVEGLGRTSKTLGKSLGGGAATALAEARAAAEAKIAERDRKEEEMTMAMGLAAAKASGPSQAVEPVAPTRLNEGRMSVSDLFPTEGRVKEKHKAPEKVFSFAPKLPTTLCQQEGVTRMSTSTTPPNSPPPLQARSNSFSAGNAPVFNKPPPVFVPPVQFTAAEKSIPLTATGASAFYPASKSSVLSSMAISLSPRLPSPKGKSPIPLTSHSTFESVQSDVVFDHNDHIPAWMPSTQETEYTSGFTNTQSQPQTQICDEDDSWPVDEKLAAGVQWTFGASKEDSMTWSTLPSQSQRGETGPVTRTSPIREERSVREDATNNSTRIPGAFGDVQMDDEADIAEEPILRDKELEEIVLGSSKANNDVSELKIPRSQSQLSMASSESSQSHVGFLGQASKLLSGALGTSKKKQPEVKKVLQMAAVAAKKQQEEADKKAARLKEMESRRQQAMQRKAEEEKAKVLVEERKLKEESERRKREREELTDKRPLKPASKKEDESQKKRKIEVEKKPEIKKPAPSVLLGKSHLKHSIKQPAGHITVQPSSSTTPAAHQPMKSHPEPSTSLLKGKMPQKMLEDDVLHPSQLVQSQMAARAKAQIDAAKPTISSESIELPDINSEYSDSEDEDRVRTFDPPDWAQSPELRQQLEMQSTINPDEIFGAVRPLRMEEMFRTRTSRFRARTSSANWTGTDRLTFQEEQEYAQRMGFR
ncbi:hypothetical protein NLJ89_g2733 [Agrocybe chaxingu]|uniref:Inner centromere protein ARK-binding domain-containing protein n=1 Tax=Agrocybe chaxingu TaxID=84603 RepID=A0A9W8MW66_9AGAR|nr:hypothetical protein NLJ89_g2733 [Agrocybe chaxingu]